jgi:hypothetical protein
LEDRARLEISAHTANQTTGHAPRVVER